MKRFISLTLIVFVFSCTPENNNMASGEVDAYVPIYASTDNIAQITFEPAKPIVKAGKIYAYGNYIYQNDVNTGIHIIDASNRSIPKKISFLKLPFSTEIAVKGNYLYSNNYKDLVVFDISNPAQPQLVKRVADVFPAANQEYPPFQNVFFECADETKGVVISWELKRIQTPKCRR